MYALLAITLGDCTRGDASSPDRSGDVGTAHRRADDALTVTTARTPLSGEEIKRATAILREAGKLSCEGCAIAWLEATEPLKDDATRQPARRVASVIVANRLRNVVDTGSVDLTEGRIAAWHRMADGQPGWSSSEQTAVDALLHTDARWKAALARRGITAWTQVLEAPFVVVDASTTTERRIRVVAFRREEGDASAYGAPLEGVVATINMTRRRVESVLDPGGADVSTGVASQGVRVAESAAGRPDSAASRGAPPRVGPDGQVRWRGWRFRIAATAREGVVLHDVAREVGGRPVSVLARAALDEIFVPYGAADSAWQFRAIFDASDFMLGRKIVPMVMGGDVPPDAEVMRVAVADEEGLPWVVDRGVALYERDAGVLYRHADVAVRGRELVLRTVYSLGNYDYAVSWAFAQDGALRVDVELGGVLFVKGTGHAVPDRRLAAAASAGSPVAHGRSGVHHQHFFNFRLDFDVAGKRNTVLELNTNPVTERAANPHGGAFATSRTPLRRSISAVRDVNGGTSRMWVVTSSDARNRLGEPMAYALMPGETATPYVARGTSLSRRAAFAYHQLWVTSYRPGELYATGLVPTRGMSPSPLQAAAERDDVIEDADVVLWYTAGLTHVPRPEEWPLMPVVHVGFTIRPYGFM